jgi:hypothetical protein
MKRIALILEVVVAAGAALCEVVAEKEAAGSSGRCPLR